VTFRDDEKGWDAARAYAQWNLGDPSWADLILAAAENPTATWAGLKEEGMELALNRKEDEPN
jgi:hypothetical protein